MKKDTPFGHRLRTALSKMAGAESLSDAQIASEYGELIGATSDSGVANYLKGGRYPNVENIKRIAQFVGCSLDWLINGDEDPPRLSPEAFKVPQRLFIQYIARDRGVTFEEVVRELVEEGLDGRARELSLTYKRMSEEELRDVLDAYFANSEPEANGKRPASKRR